ncbi:MAG: glycoside hydrolase family 88 protein [Pyrinomonadaceae bacterium]
MRAARGKREANGQKVFWSRVNGWVAGGLVRLMKELPKDHPKREFYSMQYREIMDRVAGLQQPDGLWRSSLLDPAAWRLTSKLRKTVKTNDTGRFRQRIIRRSPEAMKLIFSEAIAGFDSRR